MQSSISTKYISAFIVLILPGLVYAAKPVIHGTAPRPDSAISTTQIRYTIGAPPGFVVRHPGPNTKTLSLQKAVDVQVLLLERQISLQAAEPVEYIRVAVKPLNSQAVQAVSQLSLGFNPAYQRLVLHRLRVLRGGRVIDHTRTVKLDLLRREKNLENNLYEGIVTALAILPDVRVDDVIDYEYSLTGANPIFGSRYASRVNVSQAYPLDEFHLRLLIPQQRAVKVRASKGVTLVQTQTAGVAHYEVTQKNVAPIIEEVNQPQWYDPGLRVEVSEYAGWDEVKSWAQGLFKQPGALSPAIQQQLATWRTKNLAQPQLVGEVLRWVQGEVRYFGIELGVNSHLPAHPNLTYERRFGDCKDKSLLLATLLNELGIPATPVLASLRYQRAASTAQPSPAVFDHVIVKVVVDGKNLWLDSTRPPQFGTLDTIGAFDYGSVLVLEETAMGLQTAGYPEGYLERRQSVDRYLVKSLREPVELVSESVYSRNSAEGVRRALATIARDEFAKMMRADIQRVFTTATPVGDVEIEDDKVHNRVTLRARYRIADLFRYEPGKFTTELPVTALLEYLRVPQIPQRNAPFSLPFPLQSTHSLIVELPDNPIRTVPDAESDRGVFWNMRTRYQTDSKKFQVEYSLQANNEAVPATNIPAFIEETLGLRRKLGTQMTLRVAELPEQDVRKLKRTLARFERFGKTQSDGVNAEIRAHLDSLQITRDIESGKLSDKQLAKAYSLRALAWDDLAEVEASLRDIRKAIELAPNEVAYLFTQGRTLLGAGRAREALEVLEAARKLVGEQGVEAHDYRAIGIALHYLGRSREAAEQLARSEQVNNGETNLYLALWQHIVAKRSGVTSSPLETQLGAVMDRKWPYPVAEMLLGRLTPEKLLDAATSSDLGVQRDQLCEAHFYIGQKYLWEGRTEQARSAFEKSVAQEALPYAEYGYALHELGRMKTPRNEPSWWRS